MKGIELMILAVVVFVTAVIFIIKIDNYETERKAQCSSLGGTYIHGRCLKTEEIILEDLVK